MVSKFIEWILSGIMKRGMLMLTRTIVMMIKMKKMRISKCPTTKIRF